MRKVGFIRVEVKYMGGQWVFLEFNSMESVELFEASDEVMVFLKCLKQVDKAFVVDDRIVWVEIHGLPFYAWTRDVAQTQLSWMTTTRVVMEDTKTTMSTTFRRFGVRYVGNPTTLKIVITIKGIP
ncbi:hypothetical protein L1987_06757 [Smallanthus sonchifolius]|uniref:Uncharacterized protein n=1 Tax=Smallanthus sonchifolius TaxID=185202 RepID=A0ACB9JZ12_9ASTR|nr:hypothetical protein L1987_06757 [Smallanthus sonchifolius]